jgi:uncharacterized PurR-regulated membrane protein YhhQ (DUF165 family)
MKRPHRATAVVAGYLGTIPLANVLADHFQNAPMGFGLVAPAGVYAVGFALVLRDWARELAGRGVVFAAMLAGVALSYQLAGPGLAAASAAAFALSEVLDFSLYEWLRGRDLITALAVSNIVGLVADSVLFLSIAFHSLRYLPGQLVGKALVTLGAVLVLALRRRRSA